MGNQKPKGNRPNNDVDIEGDISDSIIVTGSGNVIIGMKKGMFIFFGIAFVILLFFLAKEVLTNSNSPFLLGTASSVTETPTITSTSSPIPTDTVPPGAPTSTPVPPTDTPTLTPSPIPPVPLGEDWMKGCISSVWRGYPSTIQTVERGDGCLQEPVHVFSAEFGDLDFLAERTSRGDAEIYGLFAPLPTDTGSITVTIRFKELTNVDLWMGIFPEPDVNSTGLLLVIPNTADIQRNTILQKDVATYQTMQGTIVLPQGNGYSISFVFTPLSVIGKVNPAVFATNSFPMASQHKWLFFGYKGLRGAYRIEGTFLNFELMP